MKNSLLLLMLISFFAVSPSYAQDNKTVSDINSEIDNKLQELQTSTDKETKKAIKADIKKLRIDLKEAKKKEKEAERKNDNLGYTLEPITKNIAEQSDKDLSEKNDNKRSEITQLKIQLDQLNEEKRAWEFEKKKMVDENNHLKNQLNELLTENFMERWGKEPFSKFDENAFKNDIKKSWNTSEIPPVIGKLSNDYQVYQDGVKCIKNEYNGQSIKSVIGKIKTIHDETPNNSDKKKELADLHKKLSEYKDIVRLFQFLINDVTKMPGINKKEIIERAFADKDVVDPESIRYIESIPWLKEQLIKFKEELVTGKKDVQNRILHLLNPK